MRKISLAVVLLLVLFFGGIFVMRNSKTLQNSATDIARELPDQDTGGPLQTVHPLSIQSLREGEYPGSEIVIEQTLDQGSNYSRFIASYKSEGLKIYTLLTIPNGSKPANGWPVIIFNHGYIPPSEYRTTERYIAYTDAFSRNGYIVFRSDYRGHGNSEGRAEGGYGSNAYTIDILNAVSSIKRLKDPSHVNSQLSIVNPERIGMWGHSMGGHITLRSMVVNKDIKAGVIWGGVVVSYPDLLAKWRRGPTGSTPSPFPTTSNRGGWRRGLTAQFGTPKQNPDFWNSISSNTYLSDISGPIQLHHGESDESVPAEFSRILHDQLTKTGKNAEVYTYPGDDHDITSNFGIAMQRSVEFFDKYLK